jgi:hypothetical protein
MDHLSRFSRRTLHDAVIRFLLSSNNVELILSKESSTKGHIVQSNN